MHLECFYKWLKKNKTCPICRDYKNIHENLLFLIEEQNENVSGLENTEITPLLDTPRNRITNNKFLSIIFGVSFFIIVSMLMTMNGTIHVNF